MLQYNQTKITPQSLFEQFNAQHKDLQFTINEEINNQIAYLDLNLINKQGQIEIYRKSTMTDITIKSNSCHPKEQKLAAYKKLLTLPLKENIKHKEINTIINIALNNGYRKEDILHLHNKFKQKKNNLEKKVKKIWVAFTYTGNYIWKITKLLKDTNINIAFKVTSPIHKLLNEKLETNSYEQSGIYKIKYTLAKLIETQQKDIRTHKKHNNVIGHYLPT
jgi:hypothetical protein